MSGEPGEGAQAFCFHLLIMNVTRNRIIHIGPLNCKQFIKPSPKQSEAKWRQSLQSSIKFISAAFSLARDGWGFLKHTPVENGKDLTPSCSVSQHTSQSANRCRSHLLRFIPCTALRPRPRNTPRVALSALQDWVLFHRLKDERVLQCCRGTHNIFAEHRAARTDQLPAKSLPSQSRARKAHMLPATNRLCGTTPSTRLCTFTLLRAVR